MRGRVVHEAGRHALLFAQQLTTPASLCVNPSSATSKKKETGTWPASGGIVSPERPWMGSYIKGRYRFNIEASKRVSEWEDIYREGDQEGD